MKKSVLAGMLGVEKGCPSRALTRARDKWVQNLRLVDLSEARKRVLRDCRPYRAGLAGKGKWICDYFRICPMCRARAVEGVIRRFQGHKTLYGYLNYDANEQGYRALAKRCRRLLGVRGLALLQRTVTVDVRHQLVLSLSVFLTCGSDADVAEGRKALADEGIPADLLSEDVETAAAQMRPMAWTREMGELDEEQVAAFVAAAQKMRNSTPRKKGDFKHDENEGVEAEGEILLHA